MNCAKTQEELFEYLEGSLSPERRAELECHLEGCTDCSRIVNQHRTLGDEIGGCFRQSTENVTLGGRVRDQILADLEPPAAPARRQWFLPFWKRVLVPSGFAACLLCVVLLVGGKWSGNRVTAPGLQAAEPSFTVSQTIPRGDTKYQFRTEGEFVVDALVEAATLVQQTLRSAEAMQSFHKQNKTNVP